MKKEFVKAKMERTVNRSNKPSVIVNNDGLKKTILEPERTGIDNLFIIHERKTLEFKLCEIVDDDPNNTGYNILYRIKLSSEFNDFIKNTKVIRRSEIGKALSDIVTDGYEKLAMYMSIVISAHVDFESISI